MKAEEIESKPKELILKEVIGTAEGEDDLQDVQVKAWSCGDLNVEGKVNGVRYLLCFSEEDMRAIFAIWKSLYKEGEL